MSFQMIKIILDVICNLLNYKLQKKLCPAADMLSAVFTGGTGFDCCELVVGGTLSTLRAILLMNIR